MAVKTENALPVKTIFVENGKMLDRVIRTLKDSGGGDREGVSIARESRTFGTARPGDLAVTQIPLLRLELVPVDLAPRVSALENLQR